MKDLFTEAREIARKADIPVARFYAVLKEPGAPTLKPFAKAGNAYLYHVSEADKWVEEYKVWRAGAIAREREAERRRKREYEALLAATAERNDREIQAISDRHDLHRSNERDAAAEADGRPRSNAYVTPQ